MKKRIVPIIILLGAVVLYFFVVLTVMAKRERWHVTGDEPREWARRDYEKIYSDPLTPLPSLATAPAKEPVEIDLSKKNTVIFKWPTPENGMDLSEFGERIHADPATAVAALPNGQKVSFLGFAVSPSDLSANGSTYRQTEVAWRDPVTLKRMENPASQDLPSSLQIDRENRQLILAFRCDDTESRPVQWRFTETRNARTLTRLGTSQSSTGDGRTIYYATNSGLNHNAPVDLCVSLGFGETESVVLSPAVHGAANPARFPSGAAEVSVLFSTNGHLDSSSWGGVIQRYSWRSAPPASFRQSLFFLRVWPENLAPVIEARTSGGWNGSSNSGRLAVFEAGLRVEELREIEVRRFPNLAHCVFRLAGLPDLPEAGNLFATDCGPVRFRHGGELRDAIAAATGTDFEADYSRINSMPVPMEFQSVSPAQLLDLIEAKTGTKYHLDRKNHRITHREPPPLFERFKNWLGKWVP